MGFLTEGIEDLSSKGARLPNPGREWLLRREHPQFSGKGVRSADGAPFPFPLLSAEVG
jgi:hypothetical protein